MTIRPSGLLFLLCVVSSGVSAGERLDIALFPYSKVNETDLTVVKKLWDRKIQTLVEEFAQTGSSRPDFAYLGPLRIVEHTTPPASQNDLADFWNRGSFLTVLTGGLVGKEGNIFSLSTNIYLGELNGSFAKKSISVDSRIIADAANFESTKDGHIVPTLFALALQAKLNKRSPAVVSALLNRARMIAIDLGWNDVPGKPTDSDLSKRAFFESIDKELEALGANK